MKLKIFKFQFIIVVFNDLFFYKVSYIGVLTLPLIALFFLYRENISKIIWQKIILLIIFTSGLWLLKNFIISGCLIFPLKISCFDVAWTAGRDEVDYYSKVIKGFARDTRDRLRYLDFDHTIYSFNWFVPWFKDYAINTAFLKISSTITIISIFSLFVLNFFKKIQNISSEDKKIYLIITFVLSVNLFIWFQAPEIRFGWGTIISISCFYLSIVVYSNRYFLDLNTNYLKYITIFFLILLVQDNHKNFSYKNLITPQKETLIIQIL